MHSFRSRRSLLRLRLGSVFYLLFVISFALLVPAILWGTVLKNSSAFHSAAWLGAVCLVAGLLYLLIGAGVRCPLCHGPLLGNPRCSRNRNAQRTLGSYRLAVSLRVIFLGRFRCPCCGEACQCRHSGR